MVITLITELLTASYESFTGRCDLYKNPDDVLRCDQQLTIGGLIDHAVDAALVAYSMRRIRNTGWHARLRQYEVYKISS